MFDTTVLVYLFSRMKDLDNGYDCIRVLMFKNEIIRCLIRLYLCTYVQE